MSGKLMVIGLGPGDESQLTPQASEALASAQILYGYGPYLDRVPQRAQQRRVTSGNRQEIERASEALQQAAHGATVAIVSGGDPGVFAMAAAVCQAMEQGPCSWRELELAILPGITGMLAVAARVGAPLGHDFCALSLSDNLKPWSIVEKRLQAAAGAGLVIALYNPVSRARPWQLDRAFELLRELLPAETPVVFGRAIARPDEHVRITALSAATGAHADMATCVIVGSSETRLVERPNQAPLVYTPRGFAVSST
jgi:precorrin-3B C17-methyltransferase